MGDWVLAICTAIGAVVYLNADSKLPQLQVGDPMGPQVFPALIGIGLLGLRLAADGGDLAQAPPCRYNCAA